MKFVTLFLLAGCLTCTAQEFIATSTHPLSKMSAELKDNGFSAWLYMKDSSGRKTSGCFAYSPIKPVDKMDFRKIKTEYGGVPVLVKTNAATDAVQKGIKVSDLSFVWSTDGKSVALVLRKKAFAMLVAGTAPSVPDVSPSGYTKAVKASCLFGNPWDDSIYKKTFAGKGQQDTAPNTDKKSTDKSQAAPKQETKLQNLHMHFSADCFNKCWKYIDMKKRSEEDAENMLLLANASLWHWKQRKDCTPRNLSIAYWQLARVNCLAGDLTLAKQYAQKCLDISIANKLDPFCVGYAHEALADAACRGGKTDEAKEHLAKASKQLAKIKDEADRGLLEADIQRVKKNMERP